MKPEASARIGLADASGLYGKNAFPRWRFGLVWQKRVPSLALWGFHLGGRSFHKVLQLMRDPDELFAALARSRFRSRFRLGAKETAYLNEKTLEVVLEHGRQFLLQRLAAAEPKNDGRQTPMRGHPVFIGQHATATCCRGCLAKWHEIPQGRPLTPEEIDYILTVLRRWLESKSFPK